MNLKVSGLGERIGSMNVTKNRLKVNDLGDVKQPLNRRCPSRTCPER